MKLNEITDEKAQFIRAIKDPAEKELHDIAARLKKVIPAYSVSASMKDPEIGKIFIEPPSMDIETEELDLGRAIRSFVTNSDHWVWDTWEGDAEEYVIVYMIRKT
jgi:hypothetical protein